MSRSARNKGGNNDINTPYKLCKAVVDHYKPDGFVLEPCCGSGNFVQAIEQCHSVTKVESFDILGGIDFLEWGTNQIPDWLITNPPFSGIHIFLRKGMSLGIGKIVFLCYANTFLMNGKLNSLREYGYTLTEFSFFQSPHYHLDSNNFIDSEKWPQSGFSLSATLIEKTFIGAPPIADNVKVTFIKW